MSVLKSMVDWGRYDNVNRHSAGLGNKSLVYTELRDNEYKLEEFPLVSALLVILS